MSPFFQMWLTVLSKEWFDILMNIPSHPLCYDVGILDQATAHKLIIKVTFQRHIRYIFMSSSLIQYTYQEWFIFALPVCHQQ